MTDPTPDEVALLPCPFCGGEASLEEVKKGGAISNWTVGCNERTDDEVLCYGYQSLTEFATKREAAAAWNRRDPRALSDAEAKGRREGAEELQAYRDAAQYDACMDGPKFKGWNRSQLDRARRLTEAALIPAPPAKEPTETNGAAIPGS